MIDKNILKRRLLEQKAEADLILGQNLVEREMKKEFLKILDAPLVKVIMGPRRSGKTVLSLQSQENNFYYINFDDQLTLITWFHEEEKIITGIPVHFIPLWKWLLK
ncbi:MAG: hypothetical protein MUF15_27185 [Acidobacteria bacterium]|jgi:predicted AAA+ superfamily ATPase|nr:hypothetical protein [Acidobacteriota bacterium]